MQFDYRKLLDQRRNVTSRHSELLQDAPLKPKPAEGSIAGSKLDFVGLSELREKSENVLDRFISLSRLSTKVTLHGKLCKSSRFVEGAEIDKRVRKLTAQYAEAELVRCFGANIPVMPTAKIDLGNVAAGRFSVCGHDNIGESLQRARSPEHLQAILEKLSKDFGAHLNQDFVMSFRTVTSCPDANQATSPDDPKQGNQPLLVGLLCDGASSKKYSKLGAKWLGYKAAESVCGNVAKAPRLLSAQFLGGVMADLILDYHRLLEGRKAIETASIKDFGSASLQLWVQTPTEAIRFHLSNGFVATNGRFQKSNPEWPEVPYISRLALAGFGLNDSNKKLELSGEESHPEDAKPAQVNAAFRLSCYVPSVSMGLGKEYGFASPGLSSWQTANSLKYATNDFPADKFFRHCKKKPLNEAVFLWNLAAHGVPTVDVASHAKNIKPFGLIGPAAYLLFKDQSDFCSAVEYAVRFSDFAADFSPGKRHFTQDQAQDALMKLQSFFDLTSVKSSDWDKQRLKVGLIRLQNMAYNRLARTFPEVPWPSNGRPIIEDCSMLSIRRTN